MLRKLLLQLLPVSDLCHRYLSCTSLCCKSLTAQAGQPDSRWKEVAAWHVDAGFAVTAGYRIPGAAQGPVHKLTAVSPCQTEVWCSLQDGHGGQCMFRSSLRSGSTHATLAFGLALLASSFAGFVASVHIADGSCRHMSTAS